MQSKIFTGITAGLIAGVVFGVMMTMINTADGKPMMAMVAAVVGADSLFIGWLYHLFNSAFIGALFGLLFGGRLSSYRGGFLWGALWGFVWWILGALILMPIFLGMNALAPLTMEPMRMVAAASLVGHLLFGLILGPAFVLLDHRAPAAAEAPDR